MSIAKVVFYIFPIADGCHTGVAKLSAARGRP